MKNIVNWLALPIIAFSLFLYFNGRTGRNGLKHAGSMPKTLSFLGIGSKKTSDPEDPDPLYIGSKTHSDPGGQPPLYNGMHRYYPVPKRVTLRSIEREGIGYKDGYSTFEVLFGYKDLPGTFVPLVDLRGHHLYDDTYAANAGFIGRVIIDAANPKTKIFGFNAYYDWRQGCQWDYQQLGLGLELISPNYDFRLNGSIPLNRQHRKHKCVYDQYIGPYFAVFENEASSFLVYNMELGGYLTQSTNFALYLAGGPYYLSAPGKAALGGEVRLSCQYPEYFSLEFITSRDRIFHQIYQVQVIVSLPLYRMGHQKNRTPAFAKRLYQPVQRFEIIPQKCECGWKKNF